MPAPMLPSPITAMVGFVIGCSSADCGNAGYQPAPHFRIEFFWLRLIRLNWADCYQGFRWGDDVDWVL